MVKTVFWFIKRGCRTYLKKSWRNETSQNTCRFLPGQLQWSERTFLAKRGSNLMELSRERCQETWLPSSLKTLILLISMDPIWKSKRNMNPKHDSLLAKSLSITLRKDQRNRVCKQDTLWRASPTPCLSTLACKYMDWPEVSILFSRYTRFECVFLIIIESCSWKSG